MEKQQEGSLSASQEEASGPASTPFWISGFQSCEKIHFCCLSHTVGGILLWQPYYGIFTLAPAPIPLKLQSALPAKCRPFSHGCSQPQQEDSHTSKEEVLLQLFPAGIRKE